MSKKIFHQFLVHTFNCYSTKGFLGTLRKAQNISKIRKKNSILVSFGLNWALQKWVFFPNMQKYAARFKKNYFKVWKGINVWLRFDWHWLTIFFVAFLKLCFFSIFTGLNNWAKIRWNKKKFEVFFKIPFPYKFTVIPIVCFMF